MLAVTLLFGASCKKSEIPTYNEQYASVRFPYRTFDRDNSEPAGYVEESETFEVTYSFWGKDNEQSYDFSIPVMLIGLTSNKDRTIAFEIDEATSVAPAGSYQFVSAVMPAGKSQGEIIFRLVNSDGLAEQDFSLAIKLKTSEDLLVGPDKFVKGRLTWSKRLPAPTNKYHIISYNMLIEGTPVFNSDDKSYFSTNALSVIVNALGWIDWDDTDVHGSAANTSQSGKYKYLPASFHIEKGAIYKAYARKIEDYIKEYEAANPDKPLLHEAGINKGKPIRARKY